MAVVVSLTKDKILSLIPSMEEMKEWLEDNIEIVDPDQFEQLKLLLDETRVEIAESGAELDLKLAAAEEAMEAAEGRLLDAEQRLVNAEAEIAAASEWISESGAQLAANLAQAVLDLQAAQADVDLLRDVTLPALATELEASEVKITEVRDVILPALQDQLAASEIKVTELETVTLPALQTELDAAVASVTEWQDTTYPALLTRLSENETALTTLVETTLPALNTRLEENETAISDANAAFDIAFPSGPINVSDAIIASANGKNSVSYTNVTAANKPGAAPTVASGSGRAVNDIHRNRNTSTGEVYAEWRWGGSAWQAVNYGDEILRSLDVGKLSAGTADIHTAVISKMAVQAATIIQLDATRITTGTLNTDRLNANQIAAKVATVIQLNADRITSGTIDTGRLNATEIAAAVATVIQLNASRITAGTINTDRLNANQIAAKVATVIELNANRITAGTINTDRLNANQIAAKVATVIELNATRITTGTLNTDRLNANQVAAAVGSFLRLTADNLYIPGTATIHSSIVNEMWAQVIRARKITTDMLIVGQGDNLFPDPWFEDEANWNNGDISVKKGLASPAPELRYLDIPPSSGQLGVYYPNSNARTIKLEPNRTYKLTYSARRTGSAPHLANWALYVRYEDVSGATKISGPHNMPAPTNHNWAGKYVGEFTTPADLNGGCAIGIFRNGASTTGGTCLTDIAITSMADASLIVDGAITAKKITITGDGNSAEASLVADIAAIMQLDVKNLTVTGTGVMKEAVVNKLWADVVRSRKITTDMLLVGQGENLIIDSYFQDPTINAQRTAAAGWTILDVGAAGMALRQDTWTNGATEINGNEWIDVQPGKEYAFAWDQGGVSATNKPSIRPTIRYRYMDGSLAYVVWPGSSSHTYSGANYERQVETMTIPSNVKSVRILLRADAAGSGIIYVKHPRFGPDTASLIVDGTIAARHIKALAIDSGHISSLTIDTNHLKAGAITTAKLQATAIDGMTITGPQIRTSATPWVGGGIRILGPRFTMWDSTNRQRVDFNPNADNFTITGILQATNASGQGVEVRPPTTVYGGWLDFKDPTLNTAAYIATGGTSAVSTERGTLTMVSAATAANQRRGRIRLEPNGGVMIGAAPLGTASAERQYLNMPPNSHIQFFNNDTNVGIQMGSAGSTGVQIQASGSTQLWIQTDLFRAPSIWNNTASGSANVAIYSNNGGEVRRTTSLSKYKLDQRGLDPQDASDAFLALDPVSWIDRGEHDRGEDPRRYLGFIAEQVAEVQKNYGLEGMTVHDEDGELASVAYDRLLALAVHAVRDLNERVRELEER